MEQLLLTVLNEHGILAAFLVVMILLFVWFAKWHRQERDEWRRDIKDSHGKTIEIQKESQECIIGIQKSSDETLKELTRVIDRFNK